MIESKSPAKTAKYQQILETARTLFSKYGISRVSVTEICKEAGVSKMTFYRSFNNKIELAKIVINDLAETGMEKYNAIMEQDIPYPEKVKQTLLLKIESTKDLSQELLMDIMKNQDPELMAFIEEKRQKNLKDMKEGFVKAQKEGWIRPEIKPAFIIYFLNKLNGMASDPEVLAMYPDLKDLTVVMTNVFFYGILTKESH